MSVEALPGDAEVRDLVSHEPQIVIALSGRGRRRYTHGHHIRDLTTLPHMVELINSNDCFDRASWQGERGEVLQISLPVVHINRLLHAEGSGFHLLTTHEVFDHRLIELALPLWADAREGSKRGHLYSEGLSLALLGLLVDQYHACRPEDRTLRATQLSMKERVIVRDFINSHLDSELSVSMLAELLNMSASHFSRAFKVTFGVPPHSYVTDCRISAAIQLMHRDRAQPLGAVAHAVGFSSQSHFTESFRRKVGMPPGRWRKTSIGT